MSSNINYNLNLSTESESYNVDLSVTDGSSDSSVVIDGRSYSISGDSDSISWIQEKIGQLETTDFQDIGEFKAALLQGDKLSEKTHEFGVDSLGTLDSSIKALQDEIPRLVPKGAAGIVGINRKGEKPVYASHGMTSLSEENPVDENTAFLIGSGAKMFTGLISKVLEEKKFLSLESKISDFFREEALGMFAEPEAAKNITLEMLISHTSGLQYWADDANNARKGRQLDPILLSLDPVHLFAEPGDKIYSYSNQIGLAAVFIEKGYKKGKAQELMQQQNLQDHKIGDLLEKHLEETQETLKTLRGELARIDVPGKGEKSDDLKEKIRILTAEERLYQSQLDALNNHKEEISNLTIKDLLETEGANFHGVHTFDLIDIFLDSHPEFKIPKTYADILKEELLLPLGMKRTSFDRPNENVAKAFKSGPVSESIDFEVHDPMMRGAGGLWSCMSDMMTLSSKMAEAYHEKKPLGKSLIGFEGLENLARVRGINGQTALGIDVEGDVVGKGGGVSTYDFKFKIDRSTGHAVSSMCNFSDSSHGKKFYTRAVRTLSDMNPVLKGEDKPQVHFGSPSTETPQSLPLANCSRFFKGSRGYIGLTETDEVSWNGQKLPIKKLGNGNFRILGGPPHAGKVILRLQGASTKTDYCVIQKDLESMPFKEISVEASEIVEMLKNKNSSLASLAEAQGTYTSPKYGEGGPPPFTVTLDSSHQNLSVAIGDSEPFPAVVTKITWDKGRVAEISFVSNFEEIPDKSYKLVSSTKGWSFVIEDFISKRHLETIPHARQSVVQDLLPRLAPKEAIVPMTLEKKMDAYNIPGVSIAVIKDGEVEWSQGFGNLKNEEVRVQAASISKSINSLAVLSLIHDGVEYKGTKIGLDTDISKILDKDLWSKIDPEKFAGGEDSPVTIRMLLSHTAGIKLGEGRSGFAGYPRFEHLQDEIQRVETALEEINQEAESEKKAELEKDLLFLKAIEENGRLPTVDEILIGNSLDNPGVNSGGVRFVQKPGEKFDYQGGGPMILQRIVEKLVHPKTYADYVHERVFAPLEMKHSSFSDEMGPVTEGHDYDGKPVPGGFHLYPELAAAGAWSTAKDLAKMVIEIQKAYKGESELTVGKDLAQEMIKPRMGLGLAVPDMEKTKYFFHEGANAGFRCIMVGNTQDEGAVIMTNGDNGEVLQEEILARIAEIYDWKEANHFDKLEPLMEPKTVQDIDKEVWAQKVDGTYVSNPVPDVERTMKITVENGKILMKIETKEDDAVVNNEVFETFPTSESRGCFRVNESAGYFPLDLTFDETSNVSGINFMGEIFSRQNSPY